DAQTLEITRPGLLYRRLETHPKIGLGEAFMAGEWRAADGTDLAELLTPFARRLDRLLPRPVLALRGVVERAHPVHQRNTPEGAKANIQAHYDLSNDLFAAFLDETMTYSSALFEPDRPVEEQDLADAQRRKIDAVLDAAGVTAGTRLLEIGTGWGELALRAAQRGSTVTTLTLSAEQRALAQAKIDAAGLSGLVEIRLSDYRSLLDGPEGAARFDAVVSVEMIEAVGEEFWPDYLQTIDRVLAPGGRAVIQAILMSHARLLATRRSHGWIQKHIFPGGLIPSVEALTEVACHTGLRVTQVDRFGLHYAHTLRLWRAAFVQAWPQVRELGFDETFRRAWEFYLAYCEAGFAAGYLDVAHLTLRRVQ
ncbi:MAG: cyclopropane-fatty-acyl-phospholipid synthase family protein, partial [Candidatus Phosphoribacter sp.]